MFEEEVVTVALWWLSGLGLDDPGRRGPNGGVHNADRGTDHTLGGSGVSIGLVELVKFLQNLAGFGSKGPNSSHFLHDFHHSTPDFKRFRDFWLKSALFGL
jgi:hypothetical protein